MNWTLFLPLPDVQMSSRTVQRQHSFGEEPAKLLELLSMENIIYFPKKELPGSHSPTEITAVLLHTRKITQRLYKQQLWQEHKIISHLLRQKQRQKLQDNEISQPAIRPSHLKAQPCHTKAGDHLACSASFFQMQHCV